MSWSAEPYYYGNDLAYLMAWLPLVLAGASVFSLDAALPRRGERQRAGRLPVAPGRLSQPVAESLAGERRSPLPAATRAVRDPCRAALVSAVSRLRSAVSVRPARRRCVCPGHDPDRARQTEPARDDGITTNHGVSQRPPASPA